MESVIKQYNLKGELINSFDSFKYISVIGVDIYKVVEVCKKRTHFCGGYLWFFEEDDTTENLLSAMQLKNKQYCKYCKKEIELPDVGESNYHWRWANGKKYKEQTNKKGKIFKGTFRCKLKGKEEKDKEKRNNKFSKILEHNKAIEKIDNHLSSLYKISPLEQIKILGSKKTPILQFNKAGDFIKEWESISNIIKNEEFGRSGIIQSCQNKIKHYKNYIWRYKYKNFPFNFSGIKFGMLTILESTPIIKKNGMKYMKCRCDCGSITETYLSDILNGSSKSCGCTRGSKPINKNDIIGMKSGKLTVLKYLRKSKNASRHYYECQCECGRIISTYRDTLINKNKLSCGICDNEYMLKAQTHIGEKHGRLTIKNIIRRKTSSGKYNYYMECECECGEYVEASYSNIRSKHTHSCGCLNREINSKLAAKRILKGYTCRYSWYFIHNKKKIKCRSSFEVLFARHLQSIEEEFLYEPETFVIRDGLRYTPDFYIKNTKDYIEIKGKDGITGSKNQTEARATFSLSHSLKTYFWEDIVKRCNLNASCHGTFMHRAKRSDFENIEDYFALAPFEEFINE